LGESLVAKYVLDRIQPNIRSSPGDPPSEMASRTTQNTWLGLEPFTCWPLVGVLFSALHHHNFPEVQLSVRDSDGNIKDTPIDAYLVSVSNETWHAIDQANPSILQSIPADEVVEMKAKSQTSSWT
jgi:hypothetical protein